jgi:hypothetical protein
MRNRGRFMILYSFGGGCHLLDANNVEGEAHQPVRKIFHRGVVQ